MRASYAWSELAPECMAAKNDSDVDMVFDKIFDMVSEAWDTNDLDECNRMLAWLTKPEHISHLQIGIIIAVVRLTSGGREALPCWPAARDAMAAELDRRGDNVAALMCGLTGDKDIRQRYC